MTKPYNFDIKCQCNSEDIDLHSIFGTKNRASDFLDFKIYGGNFVFKNIDYSEADWVDLLQQNVTTCFKGKSISFEGLYPLANIITKK